MTRRRYILIAAAVIATGLVAALRVRLCCVTNATTKLRSRTAHVRLPVPDLTPDRLERARAAMEDLDPWGDASTYGRKP